MVLRVFASGAVAELADALDLGSSSLTGVQVRVLSAPLLFLRGFRDFQSRAT